MAQQVMPSVIPTVLSIYCGGICHQVWTSVALCQWVCYLGTALPLMYLSPSLKSWSLKELSQ